MSIRGVGDPQSPVSLHRYLYGNNSPIYYSDPSGEFVYSIMSMFVHSSVTHSWSVINGLAHVARITLTKIIEVKVITPAVEDMVFQISNFEIDGAQDIYMLRRKQISIGCEMMNLGFKAVSMWKASAKAIVDANKMITAIAESSKSTGTNVVKWANRVIKIVKDIDIGVEDVNEYVETKNAGD